MQQPYIIRNKDNQKEDKTNSTQAVANFGFDFNIYLHRLQETNPESKYFYPFCARSS